MAKFIDLTGKKIGHVEVLGTSSKINKNDTRYWACRCICGNLCDLRGDVLKRPNLPVPAHCGCKTSEAISLSHRKPGFQSNISRIFRGYIKHAKDRGILCLLTRQEFEGFLKQNCFYCGLPPSNRSLIVTLTGEQVYYYSGIDRLDSDKNYDLIAESQRLQSLDECVYENNVDCS